MKTKLLTLILLVFSFSGFSQEMFIVPETWEIDTWNGSSWDNFSQTTYTFNASCMPTFVLSQAINPMTSNMENSSRKTITYSGTAPHVVGISEVYDSNTSTWSNFQKREDTHDANGDVIETINYSWTVSGWQVSSKSVSIFGAPGQPSQTTTQNWDAFNSVWVNNTDNFFTYTSGKVKTDTEYAWDIFNSVWVESTLKTNTYSGGLLTTSQRQKWDGAQWENHYLETYTYDGNDYVTEILETKWNGTAYENNDKTLFTNNAQGYPTTTLIQSWVINAWVNSNQDRRTYPSCAFLSVNDVVLNNMVVYPNPSSDKISINVETKIAYNLVNIQGQLINKGALDKASNSIDISSFNSGIYFLNLENGTQKITKKVIKQ